jgi:hypothetical protein
MNARGNERGRSYLGGVLSAHTVRRKVVGDFGFEFLCRFNVGIAAGGIPLFYPG